MAAKSEARLYEPSPRSAHRSCCVNQNTYILFGNTGDDSNDAISKLSQQVEVFNSNFKTWEQKKTSETPPPGLRYSACASIGGMKGHGSYYSKLSLLDTSTMEWKLLTTDIGPMKKQSAGMVAFHRDKLALYGGYGTPSSPTQPGASFHKDFGEKGWTNEFHIFNISNAEEDQRHCEAYQKVLQNGVNVAINYLKSLMLGPPRAGKTSFRRRLIGEIIHLIDQAFQPSTGTVDAHNVVVKLTEEKMTSLAAAISKTTWRAVAHGAEKTDLDEELYHLYQFITEGSVGLTSTVSDEPQSSANESVQDLEIQENFDSLEDLPDTLSKSKPSDSQKALATNATVTEEQSMVIGRHTEPDPELKEIERALEAFNTALKSRAGRQQLLALLEKTILLNMVDTGGQPAFVEMLPMLTIGPALYLIFLRLDQELKQRYKIQYVSEDNEEVSLGESSYTFQEVIFQVLSSIACFRSDTSFATCVPEKPQIACQQFQAAMLVSTYKDKLEGSPEEVQSKIKQIDRVAASQSCTAARANSQVAELSNLDPQLQSLCKLRPDATLLLHKYLQSSSVTQVVHEVVLGLVNSDRKIPHSLQPGKHQNRLQNVYELERVCGFEILCKLALEDLEKGCVISSADDSIHFLSTFCCKYALESFDYQKCFGMIVRLSEHDTSVQETDLLQIAATETDLEASQSSRFQIDKEFVSKRSRSDHDIAAVTVANVAANKENEIVKNINGHSQQNLKTEAVVETHGSSGVPNETRANPSHDDDGICYKFIHPLLQEFLAAFALNKLPPLDQIQFLAEHLSKLFEDGHTYWLQFFIGISYQKEDDGFNATKMMTSTLLNVICHYLDITNHPGYIPIILRCLHEAGEDSIWRKIASNHKELLTLEMTLDEFKGVNNNTIVAMVTHCGIKQWMIVTSPANVKVITESFIMQKNVTIIAKDDGCTKVKISPQYSVGRVPERSLQVGGACGVHSHEHDLNNFLTQATREILSRVLQLYSKIKLKEGQESVSYVNFISCECFQNAVEASVTFEPTLPIHFLKIPAPKKKKTSHKMTRRAMDSDALHLETAHNGDTVEMVLLNKPYLRSVTFKLPLTSQEYCIRLSGDYNCSDCYSSPRFPDYGDIASQVQMYGLQQNETFCHFETAPCMEPTMSQMVYPLIPELSKARALSHHPRTTRTPVLSRQNSPSELEQACESETQPGTKVQVLQVNDEQSSPNSNILKSTTHSIKVSKVDTRDENGVTEAAGHDAKVVDTQSAGFKTLTVNTVMTKAHTGHTTEDIQSSSSTLDQHSGKTGRNLNVTTTINSQVNTQISNSQSTSPLHRESTNGATAIAVGGAALTGKTSRTKTGDQCRPFVALQSSSKRQEPYPPGTVLFTSLPRVFPTDLIQPLPDESQLIKRGGNGAIFAGTIMGMSLAIKKTHYRSKEFEILTKIRHRNIVPLLTLILGHEIPSSRRRYQCFHIMPRLTGDCARMLTDRKDLTLKNLRLRHRHNPRLLGLVQSNVKYIIREVLRGLSYLHSLHIAHRDVKGGNILLKFFCSCDNPLECGCSSKYQVLLTDFDAAIELDSQNQLPPTSSTHNHTRPPRYHCVPVGTNGYRAPECSMHVITSTPDGFSPPISTKCDSWSVGVLTNRILVGYEGPYSQREMAVLVLRYHQIAGFVEGVSRFNIAHIDDYVLESVLQLSSLRREVEWMNHASSFVECSMELDPSKRHSTDQLLKHPFLH